ncbi:MAG: putative membrane protein YjdF [Arenicella sp.]|jgi:uncharacterized membrane protein YjdF
MGKNIETGIIIVFSLLVIVHFIMLDYENFRWSNLLYPLFFTFSIIGMLVSDRYKKKAEQEKTDSQFTKLEE